MRMNGMLTAGLLAIFVATSGCASTEYVEIRPKCTPPSPPALPVISMGETWELLGDARYRELERYILQLWSFADEQSAMLDVICGSN